MKTILSKTAIPGPKSQALLSRRKAAVPQGPFNIAPIFVERSEGATVTDKEYNVALVKRCVENGVILIYAGAHSNCLRFLVPLVITDEQLDEGPGVIEKQL